MGSGARMATRPLRSSSAGGRRGFGWPLVVVIVAGVAVYLFLSGDQSLHQLTQTRVTLAQVQAEAARLQTENDSLRHVLWLLDNDLGYVEKVAREEYGMSRKDEIVYRLRSADSTSVRR